MTDVSGQVLAGRYLRLRRLGAGRHGEAWRVRDRDGVELVVKVLQSGPASDTAARAAFLRGAELQRSLRGPGVLECLAVVDGDPPHAVFHGRDLRDLVSLRGAGTDQVRSLLAGVARACARLHAAGVVHRDLKSSNVLVDEAGEVLLTDFDLAARPGATDAPAGGSPYTASPEQLAGAPPSVTDDVYSLGALGHELLTGYPPYYPDAAGAREATQPPTMEAARNPVPPALAALVARCLARRAADRPQDMNEVLELLERPDAAQANDQPTGTRPSPPPLRAPDPGPIGLEPTWKRNADAAPDAATLRSQGFRRGLLAGSLAFLLVVAGVVIFALPDWIDRHPVVAAPPPTATVATPAKPADDAAAAARREQEAREAAERATKAAADAAARQRAAELAAALAAGATAIESGNAVEATRQYALALALDPKNAAALKGRKRASTLDEVRTLLATAAEQERTGQTSAAQATLRRALVLDPDTTAARTALARIESAATADAFAAAMARALAAVQRNDIDAARQAYRQAGQLRPGAPEVRDGLAALDRAAGDAAIAGHLATARRAESEERWRDALAAYQAALGVDPQLLDGQQGVARVEPRVMLDAAFDSYLEQPQRMFSSDVRGAARATLAQAAAVPDPGPRLRRQIADTTALLAAAETPVEVAFASDNLTDVVIYRVGRLGTFERKAMELLPGRYTVVGSRTGYRDVRREVTILPGRAAAEVVIRCEERI